MTLVPVLIENSDPLGRWRFVVTAVLLLLLSACSLATLSDEERSAQFQRHMTAGEVAWQGHDYTAARSALAQARLVAAADGQMAFQLGYLHEKLGNYADAASVYRDALQVKTVSVELQHDLTYRLALLEAFRLHGEALVPGLLATLPPDSAYAADLHAVLALLAGDGRKALAALNQARNLPLTQELSSIILYHAAKAYSLTGEVDRAMQNLYEAINRAGSSPISKDIAEFRDYLRSQPRP